MPSFPKARFLPTHPAGSPGVVPMDTIKKIFLWTYERNTWQWDTLCALILVFIFLTPKSWFSGSERPGGSGHQSPVPKTVLVGERAEQRRVANKSTAWGTP